MPDELAHVTPVTRRTPWARVCAFFGDDDAGGGAGAMVGIGNVLIADLALAILVGVGVGGVLRATGYHGLPRDPSWWKPAAICFGIALWPLGWLAWAIGWPRVAATRLSRVVRIYASYCTTHPSYALLDLLWLPAFIVDPGGQREVPQSYWSDNQWLAYHAREFSEHALRFGACVTLVAIAALRLAAWYGLRRRLSADESRRAWQPVAMLMTIAVLFVLAIARSRR